VTKVYLERGGSERDAPRFLRKERLDNFGGSVTYGKKEVADYAAFEAGLLDGERRAAASVAAGGSGADVSPKVEVPHIHIYNSPLKRFWFNVVGFASQLVGGVGKVTETQRFSIILLRGHITSSSFALLFLIPFFFLNRFFPWCCYR